MTEVMSVNELADKLKINASTIRTWLDNYRFAKFRQAYCAILTYETGKEFWNTFNEYLKNKYSTTAKKVKRKIAPLCDMVE